MYCLKCGRDIDEGQVFCDFCLEVMKKYPVKPGIAIQIPHKKDPPAVKKGHAKRKQPPTPEERIHRMKKHLLRMVIVWLVTLTLLAATIYPTVEYFLGKTFLQPGQNYSTITDANQTQP